MLLCYLFHNKSIYKQININIVSIFTQSKVMRHLLSLALLFSCCVSCLGSCPWQDSSLLKWSEAGTWDSGELPSGLQELVTIRVPIKLDIVTPALKKVIIVDGGKLGQ